MNDIYFSVNFQLKKFLTDAGFAGVFAEQFLIDFDITKQECEIMNEQLKDKLPEYLHKIATEIYQDYLLLKENVDTLEFLRTLLARKYYEHFMYYFYEVGENDSV